MAKSVEETLKALKLKATAKENTLTIKVGAKKFALPYETRMLVSEEYAFIHVLPSAGIFKFQPDGLVEVTDSEEARKAQLSFRQSRKKSSPKKRAPVELPTELQDALSRIPSGYRLGFGSDGQPRLVKTRVRTKK